MRLPSDIYGQDTDKYRFSSSGKYVNFTTYSLIKGALMGKVIETIQLSNSVKITITNISIAIALDTKKIEIVFSVSSVTDFTGFPQDLIQEAKDLLGENIVLKYHKVRPFVKDIDAENIIETLVTDFKLNTLPYIAKPNFPQKLTLKQYKDRQRK